MNPNSAISATMTSLLFDYPFFGSLIYRLIPTPDPSCDTAWTDGVRIGYNPEYFGNLTKAERLFVGAHEVLHCADGHIWRRDGRESKNWNRATDYVINGILKRAGIGEMPEGGLYDPQFDGMSPEQVYQQLPPDPEPDGGGGGGDDPGGCGGVRDTPDPAQTSQVKADWEAAVMQAAMQAEGRGTMPAGMERLVQRIRTPACTDLVGALIEHVQRSAKEDYSWRLPNPRYIAHGLYLPCLHSEQLPPIIAGVDTSGSVSKDVLARFDAALQVVLDDARPEQLHVFDCDSAIHAERDYNPGDSIHADHPGGGGTDFRPVFERVEERAIEPCAAIYLTDLDGAFPDKEPDYPVIWCVYDPQTTREKPPFGSIIYLED